MRFKQDIKLQNQEEKDMQDFGGYVRDRRMANNLTLATLAQKVSTHLDSNVARSTLNAIEKNGVNSIKPDILEALSVVLGENYQSLVNKWVSQAYDLKGVNIVKNYDDSGCVLGIPDEWGIAYKAPRKTIQHETLASNITLHKPLSKQILPEEIELITLTEFRNIQGALPRGSKVFVAATDFLDDDVFYKMALNNFKKPVYYYYYLEKPDLYKAFIDHVIETDWDTEKYGELHGKITHDLQADTSATAGAHTHRNANFPLNCVLLEPMSGPPQAYLGLIVRDRPAYYQVADVGLTYRVKAAFQSLNIVE